jgi:hypothetical protein
MCYNVGYFIFSEICKCYCFLARNKPLNEIVLCFLKQQPGISDFPHANIPPQQLFNHNLMRLALFLFLADLSLQVFDIIKVFMSA